MATPVSELKKRSQASLDIKLESNQAAALRVLAAEPDQAFPPSEIEKRTKIPEGSGSKVLSRLARKGAADNLEGHYFVNREKLEEIRMLLGDMHQRRMIHESTMAEEDYTGEEGDSEPLSEADVEAELSELEESITSE